MIKVDESNKNVKNRKSTKIPIIQNNIKCLICKKKIKRYKKMKTNFVKENNKNNIENDKDNQEDENNEKSINNEKNEKISDIIYSLCNECKEKEAVYECLNCDLILCDKCKLNHLMNPSFQMHKIVNYELNQNNDYNECPIHKLKYKYFCLEENKVICFKCILYQHKGHNIKYITEINDYYIENIEKEIKKGNINITNLEELINSLNELKQKLEKEKNIIIKKLIKNFNDITNIILAQKDIINNKINIFFGKKNEIIDKKISTLNLIHQRFDYYKNYLIVNKIIFLDNIKDKLNKIQLFENLKYINRVILNKINYDYFNKKEKLTSYSTFSIFINEPIKKISEAIKKYNFLPLPINILDHYKKLFKFSNILSKDLITTDLLLILPKIITCKLLYRVSHLGPSTELFHKLCDNKGPTLLFVKTATGHIFGAFNSLSFKSISKYELSYDNFLFSISDGRFRRPMRCKIVKQLAEYALKQSVEEYSPGFGLSNDADLFIAFKKLNNSYSHLGKIYKCPKGYNPTTFLAGKENHWDILDIEIYAINYISDDEFFNLFI